MTKTAELEEILNSPLLPQILNQIREKVNQEQAKRQEFYEKISEDTKAEFIQGEIIFHSPAKSKHLLVVGNLFNLIKNYVVAKNLGKVFSEHALVSLTRNDYEPDIAFWGLEKAKDFKPNQMKFPAPDFVVEVLSETTEKIDRGIKFIDYALHQVAEYWIIDPDTQFVEQYVLANGEYQLLKKTDTGYIQSQVISGFRIPVAAIFDENQNIKALKKLV